MATPANVGQSQSWANPQKAGLMSPAQASKLAELDGKVSTIIVSANQAIAAATNAVSAALASTSVAGLTKLSVQPAVTGNPIAVGDNDPRVQSATTSQPGIVQMSVAPVGAAVAVGTNDPRVGPMTTTQLGIGKPDGTTITVAPDGTLSASGGSFNIMSLFEINNIQGGGASVCATAPLILNSGNAATCTSPCLYVVGGSA